MSQVTDRKVVLLASNTRKAEYFEFCTVRDDTGNNSQLTEVSTAKVVSSLRSLKQANIGN